MHEPVEVIHSLTRLRIMMALLKSANAYTEASEPDGGLEFASLKSALEVTDGNLGSHLRALETAGLVAARKIGGKRRKERTMISLTGEGRDALLKHRRYIYNLLDMEEAAPQPSIRILRANSPEARRREEERWARIFKPKAGRSESGD